MTAVALLKRLMEGVVLLLVVLAPWAFGAVEPLFEFCLLAGVGVLLVLWAACTLLEWRVRWQRCPVALCLAGLFMVGCLQLTPLPDSWLRTLSPETARLYGALLPRTAEVLPDGEAVTATPGRGRTLSLYPSASRVELLRLLAVLCLFAAVRNNVASAAALRRLAVVATVNGASLALFALVQHFASPRALIYWTFPAPTDVFGPFICRNHFPFYLNICIGLACGLLLSTLQPEPVRRGRRSESWLEILQKPLALWLVGALALMVSSVLLSRSRGGVVALLGAAAVTAGVRVRHSGRLLRSEGVILLLALGLGAAAWFSFDAVDARLASLWQGGALQETRAPLWSMLAPLLREFPTLGTGLGTFTSVESLHRTSAEDAGFLYEHAHNEYLETWIEAGLPGLLLALLTVFLVLRLAWRAYRRTAATPTGGLVLGAVFGFLTVVIHSVGDFGLHIPAIALLAAVVAAHLCNLGSRADGGDPPAYELRLGGIAPVAAAGLLLVLALTLGLEGWRANRVHRLRIAAYAALATDHPDRLAEALNRFAAAAQLAPDYARLQVETGQAYLDYAEDQTTRTELTEQVNVAALLLNPGSPSAPAAPLLEAAVSQALNTLLWESTLTAEEEHLTAKFITPGLRHFVRARDLCPVFGAPHVRLAAERSLLRAGDPASAYLERARLLVPADPELWYLSGLEELVQGNRALACQNWRRSLELSPRFFDEILPRAAKLLGPEQAATQVIPDDPSLLLRAAEQLYPKPDQAAQRRPLLERALQLLTDRASQPTAAELHTVALLHHQLGANAAAIQALRDALRLEPNRTDWRQELAVLLYREGRLKEAREEIQAILARQPDNADARKLLEEVTDKLLRQEQP